MSQILITGASGHFGAEVIDFLVKKGVDVKRVSALVRDESKGQKLREQGVAVRVGDYDNYESLVKAFTGVDVLLFVSSNDMVKRSAQHVNVVNAAKETKVKHILYTSLLKTPDNSPIKFVEEVHFMTEDLIKKSGIPYTILGNGLYSETTAEILIGPQALEKGIFLPSGEGKANFTARTDQSEAAAIIILNLHEHVNKSYNLVNSEANSLADASQYLSEVAGKPVPYISPDVDTYKSVISQFVPAQFVDFLAAFALAIKAGDLQNDSKDLERILGRKTTTFKQFLVQHYKK